MHWKNPNPEVVELSWILKALAATIGFAILCAYALVCFLFTKTDWQYVLQPTRTVATNPASVGLGFSDVRFGDDASGQPQLTGWWIPSDAVSDPTVLMLHSGAGDMSDSLPMARKLHDARLNVLVFDYRGYGKSGGQHPTEALMDGDTKSAFTYLTQTRGVAANSILVYGERQGASLAAQLCAAHKEIPALILYAPDGDFEKQLIKAGQARVVPVSLLFNEDFPLTRPLAQLATPKLLLWLSNSKAPISHELNQAANPKMVVELKADGDAGEIHEELRRFLDSYVPRAPDVLAPKQ